MFIVFIVPCAYIYIHTHMYSSIYVYTDIYKWYQTIEKGLVETIYKRFLETLDLFCGG